MNDIRDINKESQHQRTKEYILQYLVLTKAIAKSGPHYEAVKNMGRHGMLKK
jgi:hypothetical protein